MLMMARVLLRVLLSMRVHETRKRAGRKRLQHMAARLDACVLGLCSQVYVNGKQGVPGAVAQMMQPASGGSTRRKSTPAALDMMLRTAEGKSAIEVRRILLICEGASAPF